MDSEVSKGLYRKFEVSRTDGSSAPGGKHHGCGYFVLDLTHDTHAPAALRAYADSCEADYPQLAADLRMKAGPALAQPSADRPDARDAAYLAGIEAAAALIDARRETYEEEHGSTDWETGAREYPRGGDEYVGELIDLAESIRARAAGPQS